MEGEGKWLQDIAVPPNYPFKTIMTLRHVGLPPEMISDCEAGWSGSFDKLAAIL
jgi:hypothetical protein